MINEDRDLRLLGSITLLVYITYFILNFIGTPLLKYYFIVTALISFILVLNKNPWMIILGAVSLSLVEGQGRILWGYHPIFRVLFDLLLGVGLLKIFINRKKIFSLKVSKIFNLFLIAHLCWWSFELANPFGAGVFASFATAKYYVFPFFVFIGLCHLDLDINKNGFRVFIIILLVLLFLENLLCLYQMSLGESHMIGISPNYYSLFEKFNEFRGIRFRPWGTTNIPGNVSILFYLCAGFLLLRPNMYQVKIHNMIWKSILFINYALTLGVLIICQVRSALLKEIMILVFIGMTAILASKNRFQKSVKAGVCVLALTFVGYLLFENVTAIKKTIDLTTSISRLEELSNEGLSNQRAGPSEIIHFLLERTQFPLGFGPGMTTGFLPHYAKRRADHFELPEHYFWSMDNFFAFSILELGIGALFYIGCFLSILFYFLKKFFILSKDTEFFYINGVCLSVILTLFVTNWGAVALPFNPESFLFWLFAAIAVQYDWKRENN